MAKVKNLVGQKFGKLIVLYLDHTDERGAWWACQCDCENTTIVVAGNLKSGNTTCCNECAKNKLIERNKANATHKNWERISGIESHTLLYRLKHLWPENHLLDKPNHGNKVSRWNQQ
jgi:hypothetical protein